ncbi:MULTISPECIES: hypothetical protein [unclassified Tatumella]|nr:MULTISPECIES: hypothetical protein [unclassified Tatumella]
MIAFPELAGQSIGQRMLTGTLPQSNVTEAARGTDSPRQDSLNI